MLGPSGQYLDVISNMQIIFIDDPIEYNNRTLYFLKWIGFDFRYTRNQIYVWNKDI